MRHVRRALTVFVASATMLFASAGMALAGSDDYPPHTEPFEPVTPGSLPSGESGKLAFTGSDQTLLWVGLVVLVIGVALFVATRRRAALRRRGNLSGAVS